MPPPQQSPRSTNDIPVTSATNISNLPTTYQTLKSPQHVGPLQGGPHPIPQHISHQGPQQHISTHQAGPPISGNHHQNSYHTLTSPHHESVIVVQNQNTTNTQQLLPPPATTIAPPHVQQHQGSVYGRLSQKHLDSELHVENSKGGESPLSESSQRSSWYV